MPESARPAKATAASYGALAPPGSEKNRVTSFTYRTPPQEIDPGIRAFKRGADGVWTNAYPSGHVERCRETARIELDGCTGTAINKDEEPDFAAFIPDKGCPGMMLRFKRGDSPWVVFGRMENVR